jgi:hypothetical protein
MKWRYLYHITWRDEERSGLMTSICYNLVIYEGAKMHKK